MIGKYLFSDKNWATFNVAKKKIPLYWVLNRQGMAEGSNVGLGMVNNLSSIKYSNKL